MSEQSRNWASRPGTVPRSAPAWPNPATRRTVARPSGARTPLPASTGHRRRQGRQAVLFALTALISLVIVVPLLYATVTGFKDPGQIQNNPLGLPSPWNINNYTDILTDGTFWRTTLNSLVVALLTVVLGVSAASLAAFMFARYAFPGRELLFMLFAAGLMFPPAALMLPLFVLLRQFGLLGSPWGVILPQAAGAIPLTIIILRTFFRSIPAEVEESAVMDGCSTFGVFWRIMLPMARPALAVVSVLALVTSWNNFLLPLLVLISERDWWTLPLGVQQFQGQFGQDTARVMAYTVIATIPALAFFFVAERQIVQGIAPTVGTKG